MGPPASTINHMFIHCPLPTIPLAGIDRCTEEQFMALILKDMIFQLRKQGVNPQILPKLMAMMHVQIQN